MFGYKTDEKDSGVLVDQKVRESTQCNMIVRKANAISNYDNVRLDNIYNKGGDKLTLCAQGRPPWRLCSGLGTTLEERSQTILERAQIRMARMGMKPEPISYEKWPKDQGNLSFQRAKSCLQFFEGWPVPRRGWLMSELPSKEMVLCGH